MFGFQPFSVAPFDDLYGGLSLTSTVSEAVDGVDTFAAQLLWALIDDSQGAVWQNVNSSQGSPWAAVNSSQGAAWNNVNSAQGAAWTDVNDSQGAPWSPVLP